MKLKKLFAIFISVSLLASCDFMDCNESDYYSLKEIQGSYNRVKQFVTDVYGYLPSNFCNIDGAMLDAATDDAVHIYESSNIKRFVNGTWSPNYTVDDQFANYYNGIHDANFYLENLTGLKFETWENTNDYDNWMITYPNFEYEVRFLRAYFYFELVRRYQNVPLITKVVTQAEANAAEPASAEQIFDFIISECTELSTLLPVDYTKMPGSEYGRATRGAALALKARAALYAASPLFNSGNNKSKWVAAAEAAYEIIGQSSALGYKLDASFSNLFGATNTASNEVILVRPTGTSTSFEAGSSSAATHHNWVLFRYAEVLLNYAEAMVNAYGDINYTTDKCGMTALAAVNAVRGRTGVNMPALSDILSSDEFLKRVKHERRVELAFEGHRFWDLRRWKELAESKDVYGVKITKSNDEVSYKKFTLESRKISDKLYFYPISNTELFKNSNLKQNPGWE